MHWISIRIKIPLAFANIYVCFQLKNRFVTNLPCLFALGFIQYFKPLKSQWKYASIIYSILHVRRCEKLLLCFGRARLLYRKIVCKQYDAVHCQHDTLKTPTKANQTICIYLLLILLLILLFKWRTKINTKIWNEKKSRQTNCFKIGMIITERTRQWLYYNLNIPYKYVKCTLDTGC